jgi:pimeloyl-ACP methyl ester carboxylesterase
MRAGVASSSGETPDTIDAMAQRAADFVDALGVAQLDLLGFSLGGYVVQAFTLRHPKLVIAQPTLVVNGNNDVMIPTINSFTLSQHIPRAQLIVYPDSGHASHFQYPDLFLSHARIFLNA